MAFNQPIDADRVDGLGLISSFLRAPIIGPIIWIVGKLTKQQTHDEDECVSAAPTESFATVATSIDESFPSYDINITPNEYLPSITTEQIDGPLEQKHHPPLKKTRKTSWSDESGQRLAKYCDEVRRPIDCVGFDLLCLLLPIVFCI